jgi:hypothetical protein
MIRTAPACIALRHLYRILGLTGRAIEDTERLMRLIQDAENNVLAARTAEKGRRR